MSEAAARGEKPKRTKPKKPNKHKAKAAPEPRDAVRPVRPAETPIAAPVVEPPVVEPPVVEPPVDAPVAAVASEPAVAEPVPAAASAVEAAPAKRRPSRGRRERDTLSWVVVPKLEALLVAADTVLATEPVDPVALTTARKRFEREWANLAPIPREEADRLTAAYEERVARFHARTASVPDPRKEAEARALETKLALVAEAEGLVADPDVRAAVEKARDLQRRWREAPRVGAAAAKEPSARFKAAIDAVFGRRDEDRADRVAKLAVIVDQAELLVKSPDPARAAEVVKQLQARWKAVGGVRGEDGDALWARFRGAADAVFERRRTTADAVRSANEQAREALIAQAQALAAEGVEDADEVIRQLQGKWRKIGPIPKERGDALWSAFKAACDGLRRPPPVDAAALGDPGGLRHNPFASLGPSEEPR